MIDAVTIAGQHIIIFANVSNIDEAFNISS
jgi:hypothetical protein